MILTNKEIALTRRGKILLAGGGVAFTAAAGVGAGLGLLVESRTNAVAEGKTETIDYCLGMQGELSAAGSLGDCLYRGGDGGQQIKAEWGIMPDQASAYRAAQVIEAGQIESNRIALWALGFPGVLIATPAVLTGIALATWASVNYDPPSAFEP